MQHSASTQQLLDELAARERRVLQQLRDLSGVKQSPIAPHRPHTSLPGSPEHVRPASLPQDQSWSRASPPEEALLPSWQSRGGAADGGTAGNLRRDLERLRHLLQHSPLSGAPPAIAVARDKRERESRQAHLSASPVTPEGKRDRWEGEAPVAAPPPLTRLPTHAMPPPPRSEPGSGSPPRRSTVLEMDEEARDEDVAAASNALARFHSVSARTGLGSRGVPDAHPWHEWEGSRHREAHELSGSTTAAVAPVSASAWRRSPVRWFASSATAAAAGPSAVHDGRRALDEDGEAPLGIAAVRAWTAQSGTRGDTGGAEQQRTPLAGAAPLLSAESAPRSAHLPATPRHPAALFGDRWLSPSSVPGASPPPRVPASDASPPPRPRAVPATAALGFPTPSLAELESVRPPHARPSPWRAATPSAATQPRRPAPAVPDSEIVRTASWCALKAFYARQSNAAAPLQTPLWGGP
ncbi:hypothetical protein NESM_000051900 [Novymonas esmeraldas]|uniref:Uncharacterized protein n=1 Tax=Novymonas esmeraldas TaxID=1808958 RepID=A0AAW0F1K2_9TRYP